MTSEKNKKKYARKKEKKKAVKQQQIRDKEILNLNTELTNKVNNYYVARSKNDLSVICDLIIKGADLNVVEKSDEWTIVMNDLIEFEILSEKHMQYFDMNLTQNKGFTFLHYAVLYNKVFYIEQLIKFGSNINAQTNKGNTALHLAIAELLAAKEQDETLIRELLKYQASIEIYNSDKKTSYMLALDMDKKLMKILLENSDVINEKVKY